MAVSLEARRRAVVDALRAVAAEPPAPAPGSSRERAMERRLDEIAARLTVVETALLEDAWDRPAAAAVAVAPADDNDIDADADEERVSVPALPLAHGRMSSVASRALFGH